MDVVKDGKIDRSAYRYYLLHDPGCTRTAMENINARREFIDLGVHVHECEEKPDFSEPFGAVLWRRRVGTGYPLCVAAALLNLPEADLMRLEMGWALPEPEELEEILAGMAFYYGFDPMEYFRLVRMGEEYRKQKPIDLSEYLGLDLSEASVRLMPPELRKPYEFVRTKIRVSGRVLRPGLEFPQRVIWKDGREFPIDRIDSAQEQAAFVTGGIGTSFSCWIRGKHRILGYEQPGDWFAETPCFE